MSISTSSPQSPMETTSAILRDRDMQTVLEAWQVATDRLQRTHETLRAEVRRLTDELEVKNRKLARKNRLADLGQMASLIAHEVRNNLMPLTLYLSLLKRRLGPGDPGLEIMNKMEAGFTALEATVSDLLSFTADREPVWRTFLVRRLLDEVCESLAPQLEAQQIDVEIDAPAGLSFLADADMLRRALVNLILNAVDVMPDGGELLLTALVTGRGLEIEVADSGPGMDVDTRARVFEPFFTTKSHGTGLGLSIVFRIAEAHGGTVQAANCAQGGAAVTMCIPFRAMEAKAA